MSHWTEAYIGRTYERGRYDCGSLAVDVLREVFNKDTPNLGERPPSLSETQAMIGHLLDARTHRVDEPFDGCAAEIRIGERVRHVGIYCVVNGVPHILHNIKKHGVILTKVNEMPRFGWMIEGYYEWT